MSSPSSPESRFQSSLPELMAGVGNHEAKALLLLYMAKHPVASTTHYLSQGFNEFIGPGADWYPSPTIPFKYCIDSLAPIGQVAEETVESINGSARGFRITGYGQTVGKAAVGGLLAWSLEYPEISLQQVLGATQSRTSMRAAETRIAILQELITSPAPHVSKTEFMPGLQHNISPNEYSDHLRLLDSNLGSLKAHKLILSEKITQDSHRREFSIKEPNAVYAKSIRSPYRQSIHSFIAEAHGKGSKTFTAEECTDYVIKDLQRKDNTLDAATIRRRVINMLGVRPDANQGRAGDAPIVGIKPLYEEDFGKHTRISLNPRHREAITKLLETITEFEPLSANQIRKSSELAEDITNDHVAKIALINKAARFSAGVNKRPLSESLDDVVHILSASNRPLVVVEILEMYNSRAAHPVSRAAVQKWLKALHEAKKVTRSTSRYKESIRKQKVYYSIADNS